MIHHRKNITILSLVAILVCTVVCTGTGNPNPAPYDEVTFPFQGIIRTHRKTTLPRPLNLNVLEIDLDCPAISFLVTPGGPDMDDPDTVIAEEVLARKTTTFVAEYGLQVGVNGDFAASAPGPRYEYQPRVVLGLAVSNGEKYSTHDGRPALTFPRDLRSGTAYIGQAPFPEDVYNAIGGNKMLVEHGRAVDPATWNPIGGALDLNPRTSIGLSADGKKLIVVVVDGRQPGFSKGVTLPEIAKHLLEFGAYTGLNLDGGGSSTMVFADTLSPAIMNYPSDAGGERIVSNHLGIFSVPSVIYVDLNHDYLADYRDLMLFTDQWLTENMLLQADLDSNGFVDFGDFALMSQSWREHSTGPTEPPADQTNLGIQPVMKLLAGLGVGTKRTGVSKWEDQAKNNDAVQYNPGEQPRLVLSAVNGEPAIEFDGAGDHLIVANNPDINTGSSYEAKTLVVVFKTGSNITRRQVIWEQGGDTRGLNVYLDSGSLYLSGWNLKEIPWVATEPSTFVSTETTYVATLVMDAVVGTFGGFVNGVSIGSVDRIFQLYGHSGACALGHVEGRTRFHDGSTSGPDNFGGMIAEFHQYNDVLSDNDRYGLEQALMNKYGI